MGFEGSVPMTIVSEGEKELPDEDKGVKDGTMCEGQNAVADVELKVESVIKDVNDAGRRALQAQGALQAQQQQGQGGTICWERFLHVTSIKVLVVESDDSTRHIVAALLWNCNYEVIEAANGLQAWRVLEDLTNHIDLVLTELEMPCVSGIGLLSKIMNHKTRKNIPVIMMSSRDSMGLVFKCLSKGAVDFLVKPIRKNELKNLWQHVWRRCHSSSGSGSESGTQTQNSVKSKIIEKCGNNSGSNDGEDNGSDGLNIGDGSDNGSGTQSSWTKQAVEVDSSQAVSLWDQVTECPDSTCAQVIRPNAENSGNRRVQVPATKDCQEDKQPDNNAKCKYPVTGIPKKLETKHENPIDVPVNLVGEKHKNVVQIGSNGSSKRIEKEQIDSKEFEAQKMVAIVSEIKNNTIHESRKAVIEPSLKRLREVKESRETSQDDRYVFRRSELSAFTRYNTSSKSNPSKTPDGLTGNSLVIDNGLESANNVVSNNTDMGSTTNKLATKPLIVQDKSEAASTTNGLHPSLAYKPVKNDFRNCQSLIKTSNLQATALLAPSSFHLDIPNQHLHHHHNLYPHNSHHFHNQEQQPPSNHHKLSLKQLTANAINSDSSNVMVGPYEGKLGNHSLNRSASGSNHGSNGQDGSSTPVNAGGNNGKTEAGLPGKGGSGDASGSGSGNRMDPNKLAQREAALTKFRQKKKRRCFKNKVRYQNRKQLAEQRPRIRGQFVQQTGQNNPINNEDE